MAAFPPTPMACAEYDALWTDMKTSGMRTPLIGTVGTLTGFMRLDSGNHRIQLFKLYGVKHAPCIVEYVANHVKRVGNGTHVGIPAQPLQRIYHVHQR